MEALTDASSAWLKFFLSVVKSRITKLINKHIGQYPFYLHNNVNTTYNLLFVYQKEEK